MADLFKFAYVRGAQNALVKAGALAEYPTVEAADMAVKIASYRIQGDPMSAGVSNDSIANAMADMVAFGAKHANEILGDAVSQGVPGAGEVAEELKDSLLAAGQAQLQAGESLVEAAGTLASGQEPAAPAMPAGPPEELEVTAAMRNVARLKAAADAALGATGGELGGADQPDLESDTPKRQGAYANKGGKPITPDVTPVAPHTGSMQDHSAGMTSTASVNLDPKTAAAILRKLAEGTGALGATGGAIGGSGQSNEDEDSRGDNFAVAEGGAAEKKVNPSAPFTGAMKDVSQGMESEPGAVDVTPGKTAAAFEILLRKTAAEVGHHLPKALSSAEKLAALRTMMGMASSEKIDYLSRLNTAGKRKAKDKDKEDGEAPASEESEATSDEAKSDEEDLAEQFAAIEEESKEKSASILRALGLGN